MGDNLKDIHLAEWYKTHTEDDITNLLKSPVQGLPAGGMSCPVNQGSDNTASVITLGSRLEMLTARHKIFGAAIYYDPSTGSYQVFPATLSYEFVDALKTQGSNSERAWQCRDGLQSFMEDVSEKARDFV
eukprot:10194747-Ditylum_brightwellii.AAC.1